MESVNWLEWIIAVIIFIFIMAGIYYIDFAIWRNRRLKERREYWARRVKESEERSRALLASCGIYTFDDCYYIQHFEWDEKLGEYVVTPERHERNEAKA